MNFEISDLINASIGGAIIGLCAVVLFATLGKTAGISGIVSGIMFNRDRDWRIVFVIGLILAPFCSPLFGHVLQAPVFDGNHLWMVAAGLLVGLGTVIGNGCTSGHGICGLSRFSKRSLVAVICFMISAVLTVYITRHVVGVLQ